MSKFNIVAKGQDLVRKILIDSILTNGTDSTHNPPFDFVWQGINIKVKTRTQSGFMGSKAFMFGSFFPVDNIIYICVAIPKNEEPLFWIVNSKELDKRKVYYGKIENALKNPEEIKEKILQKSKIG